MGEIVPAQKVTARVKNIESKHPGETLFSAALDGISFMKKHLITSLALATLCLASPRARAAVLFEDGFKDLRTGSLGSIVGAHAEYHYLPETAAKGNWAITSFASSYEWQKAWRVGRHNGQPALLQMFHNTRVKHYHPMVVGGDELWRDYTMTVKFRPEGYEGRSGAVVRYHNDRCNYFVGVDGPVAMIKLVNHDASFRIPNEKILVSKPFSWQPGEELTAVITVQGNHIEATINGHLKLTAEDATFPQGRIALVADVPTKFLSARVTASRGEKSRVAKTRAKIVAEEKALQAANPKAVLWKKFSTDGFGVGRNLRFGDLDGDGQLDILAAQIRHFGPKDANSEVSCLTAVTVDGKQLWQVGQADQWKDHLSNDVAVQIHDIDGDGKNEVIYATGMELIIAEGATGKTIRKIPTPETPANTKAPRNRFPRILGDCLFFCDLRGQGRKGDLIIKDRYESVWAYDENLKLLWHAQCNTGHYPFAYDLDGDGKDEVAIGYSLYRHDGKQLWTLDDTIKDHMDGIAIAKFQADPKAEPHVMIAASDEGMLFVDIRGKIMKHHLVGHVQNPVVGEFRTDLPGLETISMNFWGNQGIVHCFDADGNLYHDFEPVQHGSMMLPINWTGQPPEYWILSPNVEDGGMYDGKGRKVFEFPADGHPDMCVAVLDLTGDCRDEIVVWDPLEVWIYTQEDNSKSGRLYKPKRNPLSNYSNYQTTVSLPGWSDDKK